MARQVYVNFNGTLSGGNAYTLGPGELDVTGTFRRNGAATVAGGVADIPGDVNAASGFLFNAATLGSLTTANWVTETMLVPDAPAANQPGVFNHFLDVQGDLFFRYSANGQPKAVQYGFWDGASEPTDATPELPTTRYSHVALVWNAGARTLQGFVDGVSQGTLSTGNVFAAPSTNVGYGFFARTGFLNRAIDGKLASVAFSTFTGTFNPGFGAGFDFQLDPAEAPTLALELRVNAVSGGASIVNNTPTAVAIQGYDLTSALASLDATAGGWRSLSDQNLDPVFGGDGPGETWEEGGHPSAQYVAEAFLLGSTTLAPGASLSLGRAYNAAVDARDLAFRYRVAGQAGLVDGLIGYDDDAPAIVGDYDNDFDVDGADLLVWQRVLGGATPLPNDATPSSVDGEDLVAWRAAFGAAGATAASEPAGASAPEPKALAMWLCGVAVAGARRRRPRGAKRGVGQAGGCSRLAAAWLALCVFAGAAVAQSPPAAYLRTPSERQLAWHDLKYYAFIHFGHNTFTNEEWGWSQSTPDVFNPTNLDTDQWAQAFKDAGMTGMILTAKHHDGMALWDTATTQYKVANGNWAQNRASQGLDANVVRMAAESAKKFGLKFGIYLSPWDMHRDPAVPKSHLAGTIYDEPQIFGDSTPGDYNDLYAQQLTELMTMQLSDGSPIEVFEVWLDGASGTNTVQTFDWTRFRDIIRQHQPDAVMWGHQGVDARWVGNEEGTTQATNWHTISRTQDQTRYSGSQLEVGVRDGLYWTPAEADARLRSGWFYHANENPKSTAALMEMYRETVGRSITLNLDVPPDAQGRLEQEDVDALMAFKAAREAFLDRELVSPELAITASSVRGGASELFGPANIIDEDPSTYWTMNDGQTTGSFEIDLGGPRNVDAFIVQEHIALGQRIGGYAIDAWVNGAFQPVVTGTSLGYMRIDSLTAPVETSRVRFRVTQANAVPLVSSFQILGDVLIGSIGDLDLNGLIDLADWQLYVVALGADLSGLTPEQAFQMGDMNGDGRNDLADFDLFAAAYDGAHGVGALAAALQVPEPSTSALASVAALCFMQARTSRAPAIRTGSIVEAQPPVGRQEGFRETRKVP